MGRRPRDLTLVNIHKTWGGSHADTGAKSTPGRHQSECKGPEVAMCPFCWKTSEAASAAGAEGWREEEMRTERESGTSS